MTRINVVSPNELIGKHLVAEYRELPRIFTLVRNAQKRGLNASDFESYNQYVLGPGHVKFFYTRLLFLQNRQGSLVQEMIRRNYKPSYTDIDGLVIGIDASWLNDWTPDISAIELNRLRIRNRLNIDIV